MKILLFSDVHFSTYSSLLRTRGEKYSRRLESLIASMNWVNEMATIENCKVMICTGDFMDRSILNDEELSALREIRWNNLPCYFLVGNHESSVSGLRFNSTKAIESSNHFIINTPMYLYDVDEKTKAKTKCFFLPYITERDRKPLKEYLTDGDPDIIFSHEDIQGIMYGGFRSVSGFSIEEIEAHTKLCCNGHLHNTEKITDKIYNLGSLTAHNFSNDSEKYKYGIWILDTADLSMRFIENPYGFSFYKLTIDNINELQKIKDYPSNSVLTITCDDSLMGEVKDYLSNFPTMVYKLISNRVNIEKSEADLTSLRGENHLQKFEDYILKALGDGKVVKAELAEVIK